MHVVAHSIVMNTYAGNTVNQIIIIVIDVMQDTKLYTQKEPSNAFKYIFSKDQKGSKAHYLVYL